MAREGGGVRAVAPDVGQEERFGWRRFDAEVLGFAPLGSKLRPARPVLELVTRTVLLEALAKTREPLVLVSALAGSGKSTTLMQWVDVDPRPGGWLALDAADNDLTTFVRYLALAVADVAPVDPLVFELLARPRPPIGSRVVPRLAAALAEAPPFLLVLDDGHLVRKRECWRVLGALLDDLPPGAQLAIGTRTDPPLPLAKLRIAGRLSEVRTDRLAMNEVEAGELLRLRGVVMNDGELGATLVATEGWAAGIYLASLVAETLPPDVWVAHVRGDQTEIARYLTDEVLRRLPADTRRFLTQTSILDRLCAGVCAAVTGRQDAHELLARIVRRNLFVTALDDRGECYRYHHLFAELLRADLERREPDEVPRLHRAAAEWYASHDDPESAVAHWLATGDLEQAAREAVVANAKWSHTPVNAARLFRLFTPEQLLSDGSLTLHAGIVLGMICGDRAEQRRWAPILWRLEPSDRWSPAWQCSERAAHAVFRFYLGLEGVAQMCRDAEHANQLLAECDVMFKPEVALCLGIVSYLSGEPQRAAQELELAARGPFDLSENEAMVLSMQSLVAADSGLWGEAARLERCSFRLYPSLGLDDEVGYWDAVLPLLAHVRVLSRARDRSLSPLLTEAEGYLERVVLQADWLLLLAAVVIGESWLEQGDLDEASRWCERALTILRRYPDAGMLGPRAHRLAAVIEERRLGEPLSGAEKRVLALLPTHLTAEEIAERLFVSANTVRTHVQHIHRKLGVTTRAEAVAKAQSLGLLGREA